MMATECCSCMSQRGVDQDACPSPKDGGCEGYEAAGLPEGTFYNNVRQPSSATMLQNML